MAEGTANSIKEPTNWGIPMFKHAPRYVMELLKINEMELLKEQRLLINVIML
jgi:hypothetical protein